MTQRFFRPLLLVLLLLAAGASSAAAQCEGLIFRTTQGDQEESFRSSEPIRLLANRPGSSIRAYWDLGGSSIATLSAQYGYPSSFGWQGDDPRQIEQHVKMSPQKSNNIERAVLRFDTVRPGRATIGFYLTGSKNASAWQRIPKQCHTLILTFDIVAPGGSVGAGGAPSYGGQGQQGGQVWVAGTFQTHFGEIVLQQQGQRVWGTYNQQRGRVEGKIEGNVFRGYWSQSPSYQPPSEAGDFVFTFTQDGRAFTGSWRYGYQGPWVDQPWNGQRTR